MRSIRYVSIMGLFFVSFVGVNAQQAQRRSAVLLPAPTWPANGIIPPELKDRYVLVDLARGEGVIAYPANLGTTAFASTPGPQKVLRFELTRNVKPRLSVATTAVNPLKYRYDYAVTNEQGAKRAIALERRAAARCRP